MTLSTPLRSWHAETLSKQHSLIIRCIHHNSPIIWTQSHSRHWFNCNCFTNGQITFGSASILKNQLGHKPKNEVKPKKLAFFTRVPKFMSHSFCVEPMYVIWLSVRHNVSKTVIAFKSSQVWHTWNSCPRSWSISTRFSLESIVKETVDEVYYMITSIFFFLMNIY